MCCGVTVGVIVGLGAIACNPDGGIGRADTDIGGAGRGVYAGATFGFWGWELGCGVGAIVGLGIVGVGSGGVCCVAM